MIPARQSLIAVVVIALLILTACRSDPNPEEAALQRAEFIPQVLGSTLIITRSGVSQGSQDDCHAGYVEKLYGTSMAGAEVVEFYHDFASDNLWTMDKDYSNNIRLLAGKQDERVFLGIVILALRGSPTHGYPSQLDPKLIDNAFDEYRTVYLLTITYTTPDFEDRCS
jgi:hypothetical protein